MLTFILVCLMILLQMQAVAFEYSTENKNPPEETQHILYVRQSGDGYVMLPSWNTERAFVFHRECVCNYDPFERAFMVCCRWYDSEHPLAWRQIVDCDLGINHAALRYSRDSKSAHVTIEFVEHLKHRVNIASTNDVALLLPDKSVVWLTSTYVDSNYSIKGVSPHFSTDIRITGVRLPAKVLCTGFTAVRTYKPYGGASDLKMNMKDLYTQDVFELMELCTKLDGVLFDVQFVNTFEDIKSTKGL